MRDQSGRKCVMTQDSSERERKPLSRVTLTQATPEQLLLALVRRVDLAERKAAIYATYLSGADPLARMKAQREVTELAGEYSGRTAA